ncbi:MAG: HAMP domain-containing histidine kinase [gamma proteobacterium symbiont of Taylorina sp.]|nr:HAMP domain-containing histidine kinase [gamma proteobacterium symbiont of Taylorina sp.]
MFDNSQIVNNSSIRLIFSYSALYITSSVILLIFVFWFSVVYMKQQVDHHIEFDAKTLISIYTQFGREKMIESIHERIMNEDYDSIYLLYDNDKNILSGNLAKIPPNLSSGWQEISLNDYRFVKTLHSDRARVMNKMLDEDLFFLNGLDVNALDSQKKLLIMIMSIGLVIILVTGLLGGFIMSRSTIRKINIMNSTILKIQNGDLQLRIPHSNTNTDYDLLATNINNMLDQIRILIADIQNISNHISHDLRTPLTRMRGKLEHVLLHTSYEQTNNILDAIDEADTLLSAFNAILRISKVESGAAKTNFTDLSLNRLIEDVVNFYEPLATEKNLSIHTELSSSIVIKGDRDMLFQALANIMDNSIKYSDKAGKINILLAEKNKQIILQIADNGKGIPESEHENVFKRFFQLTKHRGSQGHGLGLSLVAAIAKLHKAQIQLKDNDPGLIVEVLFSSKLK